MKPLILGLVANYDWDKIEPFFTSLYLTGYKGECIIFVNNITTETKNKIIQNGAKIIEFNRIGLENYIHINDYRYHLYRAFLERYKEQYSHIMLSDVRDVIFQKDPFSYPWIENKLSVFLESEKMIGQEVWNTSWILSKFGPYIFEGLKNKRISCAGVTVGTTNEIVYYLDSMLRVMFTGGYYSSIDQGVHNYMLHFGQLHNPAVYDNVKGPVFTAGIDSEFTVDADGKILNHRGDIAYIVHQYDRHAQLVGLINDLYRNKL